MERPPIKPEQKRYVPVSVCVCSNFWFCFGFASSKTSLLHSGSTSGFLDFCFRSELDSIRHCRKMSPPASVR
ncbi:hypothetical protein VNO77_06681 [Canavalia gladiata]|uniref:Uncharacterized protein n=1 Tax=Canavalia gladiata TaxID=3824 RepID=A0AAN9M7N7_CANGL